MSKRCRYCKGAIPDSRHGAAQYCSRQHAYSAKKERSKKRYHRIKMPFDELTRNEGILASVYNILTPMKKTTSVEELNTLGFDWGICHGEVTAKGNYIWRVIGSFAYCIDPKTKLVAICKLK